MAYSPFIPAEANNPNAGPLPQGFWASANGTYVQNPQENQTASYQLNNLIRGDSDYIQQARKGAMASAAARGLGNSSYAAGNAQGSAIRAALPIATNDANMFANAALANQRDLNATLNADRQNATSIRNTNTSAAASRYGSLMSYNASKYGQDQQTLRQNNQNRFDAGQADINRQFQQNMLGLQNYYGAQDWARNLYGSVLQGAYGTMFSSPDYFSDPNAAMGFVNGFGNFASNQIDQYLYGGSP